MTFLGLFISLLSAHSLGHIFLSEKYYALVYNNKKIRIL